ncbi:MAG: HAD-IA family hydrolase [Chromatiales bacterium]|nr:HAD-IA family hydrolase [Chromatiales bacterium]
MERATAPHCCDRTIRLVLFDLDGTFADTAPDLAYALNETLRAFGREPLAFEQIRPHVSHGGIAMIKAGFGIERDHPEIETYRQHLLDIYLNNIARDTRLFAGMEQVIHSLEQQDIPWGIVTNKPAWLTDPLMDQLDLTERAVCIISGDTTDHAKPHPLPILHACELAQRTPQECLYVGDAERDIEAGRNAGTATVTALFGYLDEHDDPNAWGADHMINSPLELLQLLDISFSPS